MQTITYPSGMIGPLPPAPPRRFSVAEYARMIESEAIPPDDRCELLEGWVIPKMPHNPPHDNALENADYAIRPLLPPGWRVRVQMAITTADSQPEPDLCICVAPQARRGRHPEPADIALLVEVADATLRQDREIKGRLYARAGIAVYWIVNIAARQIEVYTNPDSAASEPAYLVRTDYEETNSVPLVINGQTVGLVAVRDLLPD